MPWLACAPNRRRVVIVLTIGLTMNSNRSSSSLVTKLATKRLRQVLLSTPRYARELVHLRTPRELYQWLYYKLPYAFPLMEFPARINLEPTNDCTLGFRHCPRTLSVAQRGIGYMDPFFI